MDNKVDVAFDVTTLKIGDIVHYLTHENGKYFIEQGEVKEENIYKDGVDDLCYTSGEYVYWLPRQDQIQSMFLDGLTESHKVRKFIEWLDSKAEYNPYTYSLEMLWLMFYMYEKHNKKWNAISNVKEWEYVLDNHLIDMERS